VIAGHPSALRCTGTRINVGRDRYGGRLPWLAFFLRRAFLLRVRFDTVTRSLLVLKFIDLRLVLSLHSRLTRRYGDFHLLSSVRPATASPFTANQRRQTDVPEACTAPRPESPRRTSRDR
jgi:hypothetical protein